MQTIIGKLPKDEILINKAIVDSDMDGITCASLLKSIFGDIKIILTEPKIIQQGLLDNIVDEHTVIADLGYVKGCGLYFDHHMHNIPEREIVGIWSNAPSATGIIYEAYKSKVDLTKYKEIVEFVNHFDSGDVNKNQVENPDFFMDLAFTITRRDKSFGNMVADELWKMESIDTFKKNSTVKMRIEAFQNQKNEYTKYLQSNVEIIDNIAFVDNRGFNSDITHAYLVNVVYPDTDGVVMIKGDNADPKKINLTLSRNNFNDKVKEHNFLPIVTKLNPKISGGHKYACGVALPEGVNLEDAKKTILNMLKNY
jgi:oligoribonuclease NrnB/cAMP/cGMP phosphodiesterase (DHH superfamily)